MTVERLTEHSALWRQQLEKLRSRLASLTIDPPMRDGSYAAMRLGDERTRCPPEAPLVLRSRCIQDGLDLRGFDQRHDAAAESDARHPRAVATRLGLQRFREHVELRTAHFVIIA